MYMPNEYNANQFSFTRANLLIIEQFNRPFKVL